MKVLAIKGIEDMGSRWGVRYTRQHGTNVQDADRKSTRLNSSHANISYAVFCLKKKKTFCSTVRHRNRVGCCNSIPNSEEHTSYLQSLLYLVFRLLLEQTTVQQLLNIHPQRVRC